MEPGVELILGPMFAEKTTELLSRARKAALAGRRVLVVKSALDDRYSNDDVVTHDGLSARGMAGRGGGGIRVVSARALAEVAPAPQETVVAVDEGQFFPDLAGACNDWANRGLRVIVAALSGDFKCTPFPEVSALIASAETVDKYNGICMLCGKPGAFSMKCSDDASRVDIGGTEKYKVVCRACWNAAAAPPAYAEFRLPARKPLKILKRPCAFDPPPGGAVPAPAPAPAPAAPAPTAPAAPPAPGRRRRRRGGRRHRRDDADDTAADDAGDSGVAGGVADTAPTTAAQ